MQMSVHIINRNGGYEVKKRKIFLMTLALGVVIGSSGCANKSAEAVEEVTTSSIDFEDGQYGFAKMSTRARTAELSNVSVADFNGSKALFVENVDGKAMYLGLDLDELLGEKISSLSSIQMDIATDRNGAKFSACSGFLYAYTGKELDETKLDGWSVYLEDKNPNRVKFDVSSVSFVPNSDNYIVISKEVDNDAENIANLYIDNIAFIDAAGNVIEADTSAVMTEPEGFIGEWEEAFTEEAGEDGLVDGKLIKTFDDASYPGDWSVTGTVTSEELAPFRDMDVNVTYKFELVDATDGDEYRLIAPVNMYKSWTKLGMEGNFLNLEIKDRDQSAADGDAWFWQQDGSLCLNDMSLTSITFTMSSKIVNKIIGDGGGFAGQTHGILVYEVDIEPYDASASENESDASASENEADVTEADASASENEITE